jgi:preprotein translocase subunit SecG
MTVVKIVEIIWSLSALGLIIIVLLHSPKGDGIGGIGGQAQRLTSANSAEAPLNRLTWGFCVVFISLTVILSAGWLSVKPG